MVHRGIATLAGVLMFCFFLLSHLEPEFFLLHLYQSLIYLVIILMLFYFEDHWAYMLGMLAPAIWTLLVFSTGLLGGAARQFGQLLQFEGVSNTVSLMAGITSILSFLMIGFCAYRWKREFAGLGLAARTFGVSLGIVAVYYGVLVSWFVRLIPAR
jgi:hypothetical protein